MMKTWLGIRATRIIDALSMTFTVWFAIMLTNHGNYNKLDGEGAIIYAAITVLCSVIYFNVFRLYKQVWRYANTKHAVLLAVAITLSHLTSFAIAVWIHPHISWQTALLAYETSLLIMGGIRLLQRMHDRPAIVAFSTDKSAALIYGAGDCGSMVAKKMLLNPKSEIVPVGFIDDNPAMRGYRVAGLNVFGGHESIQKTIDQYHIRSIVIAMPSLSRKKLAEIINACKCMNVAIYTIPSMDELAQGKLSVSNIRHVDVEDLLGRDPVRLQLEERDNYIAGKNVLITGAGGSIGSELCRQIATHRPRSVLLLGHGENSIYTIQNELSRLLPTGVIIPLIADVQNKARLLQLFSQYRPEVIFHAAAHKHVPLMEDNPYEAIQNNVFGTRNVVECAEQFGCERFVLISSDKAVEPTSVMGATKRIAEMIIQQMSTKSRTNYSAVRFGNVLESRGSVIPRFKEQIRAGGPVTVTHQDMTRYFMTIPEAVALVIQAGAFARGGELFLLDMGKPVRILDLAQDLIRLSGFEPYKDIDIVFTGIRPGEKLYEQLSTEEEGLKQTAHHRIFSGRPQAMGMAYMEHLYQELLQVRADQHDEIKQLLYSATKGSAMLIQDEGVSMAR